MNILLDWALDRAWIYEVHPEDTPLSCTKQMQPDLPNTPGWVTREGPFQWEEASQFAPDVNLHIGD